MTDEAAHAVTDEDFMRQAIALSRRGMEGGAGGPFGALVVAEGRVVAEGWNQVTSTNDPTAHAEIVAIRRACTALGRFDLRGATVFTSCEPCPMCLAALYWSRCDRVVYANGRAQAAAIGFDDDVLYREVALPIDSRHLPMRRLLAAEALEVFAEWAAKPDRIAY
ncbi:nucleoside deaminase [Falsiroseomonas selenitidurans]|uniref:Nucleoside deaminase n=1 Tax=Falsiroseomonas selenitidurans TaxID=2716335 RepID=A0ABX1E4N0_9PROT|nr:nucleoside deaminase [Falsiroseomonas selenitidurans]NKC31953.1 nucleoside deaminase [Falsiroseomonas selenitidurans]